tara:strand:+ start:479 stop:1654 length:1176 start_codon:yes stop_codon:yes gene_type:complete
VEVVDVAVVGGGPAGSSAAREAAERGLSVLLFDHAHPRRKACGGGLPVKGIEWMDAPESAIEGHMSSISFAYKNKKLKIPVNKGKLIRRDDWDFYLYNRAKEAGAGHVVERVKSLKFDSDIWLINDNYKAKYIIGADGVNGFTRRHFMDKIPRDHLFAAAGYYLSITPKENEVEFILGALPGKEGYLWVFPKSDHYNIGYCYNAGTPGMKDALHKLMEERWPGAFVENGKWKLEENGKIVDCKQFGSAIPSYNDPKLFDEPVSGKNWVLCGDAAGHVNPIHGEGLNHAALGGRLAAKAVAKGDPTLFEKYWRSHYSRDMYRAATTKHRIYRSIFMKIGFALGRTPALFGMLAQLTRGEYEGKATRNFWFKLPLAILQAMFFMKHKEVKNLT